MHKSNNELIQYCKDNNFPIDEMGEDYFKAIETPLDIKGICWLNQFLNCTEKS